jgi:predicted transcriptional regulator
MKTLDIYKLRILTALLAADTKMNPGQLAVKITEVWPSIDDSVGLGPMACARELNELHAMGLVSRVSGCCGRFDYLPTSKAAGIAFEHTVKNLNEFQELMALPVKS